MFGRSGGIDGEVLAELRAIRAEIRSLGDRVANAATRDDLKGYLTRREFEEYTSDKAGEKAQAVDARRWWARYGLGIVAVVISLLAFLSALNVGIVIR